MSSYETWRTIMYEKNNMDARIRHTITWTYEAIIVLLKDYRYEDITVSDVIKKAGISRATFYRHFKSKEEVVKVAVDMFFSSFDTELQRYYKNNQEEDELYLIQHFFERIGKENHLVHLVIKANLQGLMIEGIRKIIYTQKEEFYGLIKTDKTTEEYTIDLVALSAWGLIARWMKNGQKESTKELSHIYVSSFKHIYLALFEGSEVLKGGDL